MKKLFSIVTLIIFVLGMSGCSTTSAPGGAPARLVDFTKTLDVKKVWAVNAGTGISKENIKLTPAVDNGKVYIIDGKGNLFAVSINSGTALWQASTGYDATSGMSADNRKLFLGSSSKVVAFSQSNGERLWATNIGGNVLDAPVVYDGVVLVKSINGVLTALSENNGKILWQYSQSVSNVMYASGRPHVYGKYVAVGFQNGVVAVLNVNNGSLVWSKQLAEFSQDQKNIQNIYVDVGISNGVVFASTSQGRICAFNINTGRLIWKHHMTASSGVSTDSGYFYVSDMWSQVWGFDQDIGLLKWQNPDLMNRVVTRPVTLKNYVIVADRYGYMHWMSKNDGEFVARNNLDGSGAAGEPIISGNMLFIYTRAGNLFAFSV